MENHSLTIYPDEETGGWFIIKKNGEKASYLDLPRASDALMEEYPPTEDEL